MKISVIIPVYNASSYIKQCIESVLAQTYKNWELIVIDDGSQDDSLKIITDLKNSDSRIQVKHQKNSGAGQARNAGIQIATGDYVVFLDSDDTIKNNYFELLSKKNEEIVFIDVIQVDEQHRLLKKECLSDYRNKSKDEIIRSQMTGKFLWGGVRKAVKLDLIKRLDINFGKEQVGEEAVYSFRLLYHAHSYSFIDCSVYEYVNRKGSLSSIMIDDPLWLTSCDMKKTIEEMGLLSEYGNTLNALMATACVVSLDRMARKYNYLEYRNKANIAITKYCEQMYPKCTLDLKNVEKRVRIVFWFIKYRMVTPVYLFSKVWNLIKKR